MNRLHTFLVGSACLLAAVSSMAATDWVDYSPEQFAAAQTAGQRILVDVAADWCPTCTAQFPILDELRSEPQLQQLFVRVDFDQHKEFLRAHRVARQSTLLVFDGEDEVARSVAETDRGRLREFVIEAAGK
jgi:thiol-disulfide isomerase/thioredoxin